MFLPMSWTSPLTVASRTRPWPRWPTALAGARASLLLVHERLEIRDRALHRARALDDLRQEHLAGAEQIADDLHAVHQRAFDHVERPRRASARASSASASMKSTTPCTSAYDSRCLDRLLAPGEIDLALLAGALHLIGERDEPLGRVRPAVEDHVLDVLEQIRRDVLVHRELAGVDDAHVEAGLDRVVQKRRVDRLADDVVAAERERQVADAAADLHARAGRLDRAASPR